MTVYDQALYRVRVPARGTLHIGILVRARHRAQIVNGHAFAVQSPAAASGELAACRNGAVSA